VTRFGFVTGLKSETRLIEDAARRGGYGAPAIVCAGAHAARAEAGAARLIAEGAEAVISFGLCGGLDPALRSGALILADAVVDHAGYGYGTGAALRARSLDKLQNLGLDPAAGTILGVDRSVETAVEKSRLHRETGAIAVDMESHGVARAATKADIPFLVLRAVVDPAEQNLPRAALVATEPDGGLRYGAILAALLRRPWEFGAMPRLARESRAAFAVLERALPALLGGR